MTGGRYIMYKNIEKSTPSAEGLPSIPSMFLQFVFDEIMEGVEEGVK